MLAISTHIRLVLLRVCLLLNVRAIQYKLGPERLTRLGNANVLLLPVMSKKKAPCTSCNFINPFVQCIKNK